MGVKFADGWQKKSGHQVIRDKGSAARKSAQQKASLSTSNAAQKTSAPQVAKKPVAAGKDVAQTHQRIMPETQDQGTRLEHAHKAAQQHTKVSQDARNLSALSTKATTPTRTDSTATRVAVNAKTETPQANVKQNATQPTQQANVAAQANGAKPQPAVAKKAADTNAPKTKGAQKGAAKKGAKGAPKTQAQDAQNAARTGAFAQNAGIAAAQSGQGAIEIKSKATDDADGKKKDEVEEKDRSSSAFAKGSGKLSSANKDLGGVLGGFSGDTKDSESDGEAVAATETVKVEKLPETDPEFHVYSEFDSTKPGVEHVKSKAKVFERLVEKRIGEIAKLDQEIEGRIKDIFEATPLSTRIVGDLAGELETADFLKSVYGGLIG